MYRTQEEVTEAARSGVTLGEFAALERMDGSGGTPPPPPPPPPSSPHGPGGGRIADPDKPKGPKR